MTLIKTSLLNGVAVLIRLLTLLGINKLLAVYVGPAGYAALGQFQNAITMITTFASGAVNTGITKYTAEYGDDEAMQYRLWRTGACIGGFGSLLSSILIIYFRQSLALWFLHDIAYASVFFWFAVLLIFFVFNAFLLAILNGRKEIGLYVIANISSSIFAFILTLVLAQYYGLYGALLSLAIYQSLSFFVTFSLCFSQSWFKWAHFIGNVEKTIAKNLAKFTLMALCSAVCVPITQILIRNYLGNTMGWDVAGFWEAMWRLSAAYMMLVTSTLSVYYLPKLAELKELSAVKQEIIQGYKFILPVAIIAAISLYCCRDLIITLLFTPRFSPLRDLFLGQVIGDVLKIGSWILAYVMLGKAMLKYFLVTEVIFSTSYYILVVLFTKYYGLQGIAWAYALNYLVYWLSLYGLIFRPLSHQGKHYVHND